MSSFLKMSAMFTITTPLFYLFNGSRSLGIFLRFINKKYMQSRVKVCTMKQFHIYNRYTTLRLIWRSDN